MLTLDFEDENSAGYYRRERAYSIIGNSLLEQKKYVDAADIFASGLERYPSSGESANMAFSVALARFSGGEYEPALEGFKAYLEGFPNDRNSIHGQYYLAHSHQVLTQFEDAGREFTELGERQVDRTFTRPVVKQLAAAHIARISVEAVVAGIRMSAYLSLRAN